MPCFDDNGPICAPLDGEHSSGSGGVVDVTDEAFAMKLNNLPASMAYCSIGEFYAGKTLMITGATGFIGKVMLEKLMRCCPDIKKVFLLIRPKSGQRAAARIQEITAGLLFDKVREAQPNFQSKLIAIDCDLTEPDLALKEEDIKTLQEETELAFHVAATVRFDEKLSLSLHLNVYATKKILQLAQGMKKLLVFQHVSTAYANCDRSRIEEVVYPPPVDPYKMLDAVEWMSEDMIQTLTPKLLGKRPNTYTFTKALAEYVVMEEGKGMPICITRPSIVGASWKEPFPGWIDNFNGPSGVFIAVGKGLLRTMIGDADAVVDISPVDFVVNAMIGATWHTGVHKPANIPIYNLVTSPVNPNRWGDVEIIPDLYNNSLEKVFRRPRAALTKYPLAFEYVNLVSAKIPAYIMDCVLRLQGKKPQMMKVNSKITKMVHTLKYFTNNTWEWTNQNTIALSAAMSEEDRKVYFTDVRPLHWPTYLEAYCLGTKKYVLKEDMNDIPAARSHLKMLRNIRWTFNTVLLVVFWRVLIARSQLARNLWAFVINIFFRFLRYCRVTSTIARTH
ncbi:LOW QUALITY PROTEIN: fatty acyl-CoA reductase 1 [Strongylocentrotus purpuratus]|uniref:Fatty acyl-CoA reductase n=1 Tax=Strongylocentrotus purpuratus TaxID=7668 RepID=A0A7M7P4D3_STRPU|nr:LOW QUALITY PROTEIN: fatty acyl-CoA reductase 1 [Strongylocentrotus purpuratus]